MSNAATRRAAPEPLAPAVHELFASPELCAVALYAAVAVGSHTALRAPRTPSLAGQVAS